MAKRNSGSTTGADNAKVRVFFAEVEGDNESVKEALKTMVSAMSRPVRVVSEQALISKGVAIPQVEIDPNDAFEDESNESDDDTESVSTIKRPRGTGDKKDRNAGLLLVPDLNFRPDAQNTLKDFCAVKSPKSDLETTLVVVYFMQHKMGVQKIGPMHVLTAFKEVGEKIPVDVRQTLRNVKKTKGWLKFAKMDDVKTTTQGDNFVEHEMGGKKDV
jgi:hypothetical protein